MLKDQRGVIHQSIWSTQPPVLEMSLRRAGAWGDGQIPWCCRGQSEGEPRAGQESQPSYNSGAPLHHHLPHTSRGQQEAAYVLTQTPLLATSNPVEFVNHIGKRIVTSPITTFFLSTSTAPMMPPARRLLTTYQKRRPPDLESFTLNIWKQTNLFTYCMAQVFC